jgi:hypothetical protein
MSDVSSSRLIVPPWPFVVVDGMDHVENRVIARFKPFFDNFSH